MDKNLIKLRAFSECKRKKRKKAQTQMDSISIRVLRFFGSELWTIIIIYCRANVIVFDLHLYLVVQFHQIRFAVDNDCIWNFVSAFTLTQSTSQQQSPFNIQYIYYICNLVTFAIRIAHKIYSYYYHFHLHLCFHSNATNIILSESTHFQCWFLCLLFFPFFRLLLILYTKPWMIFSIFIFIRNRTVCLVHQQTWIRLLANGNVTKMCSCSYCLMRLDCWVVDIDIWI